MDCEPNALLRFRTLIALVPMFLAVILTVLPARIAAAQSEPIRVGVTKVPAFVEPVPGQPGVYKGFSADLWSGVAAKLGRRSEWSEFPDLQSLSEAVQQGRVDVAVTDMLITSERAARLDFSYPITDGGLRLLVHSGSRHSLARLWQTLVERGHLEVIGAGVLVILMLSVVLVGFWRRLDKEFPTQHHEALAESLYRTVSLTVSGKTKLTDNPSHALAKVGAAIWLAFGAGLVAYVTASFTTAMTAESTQRAVNDVRDLAGKTVGVLKGTVGERYCQTHGLDTRSSTDPAEIQAALLSGQVAAVVGDGPMLEAFDREHPELPVTVVGPLFDRHKYAFAMPVGSALRRPIDRALLELEESGETAAIYARYFSGS